MQPYIFPYIGYFQLINSVDTFVFYDDVNFIKRGWINRNKILINGRESLISFPCIKESQNKEIREVEIDLKNPQYQKILKSIYLSYKNAPYFSKVFSMIEECFESDSQTISDLAILSIKLTCNYLGLKAEFEISSQNFNQTKSLGKADRLIKIANIKKADKYINAPGGKELYTKDYFKSHGVELLFLEPTIEKYKQFENKFVPGLSIIDTLMFNSIKKTKDMIEKYRLV